MHTDTHAKPAGPLEHLTPSPVQPADPHQRPHAEHASPGAQTDDHSLSRCLECHATHGWRCRGPRGPAVANCAHCCEHTHTHTHNR